MTEQKPDEDCVSKKPWSEVLSRSLKKFTYNAASEGGKSFGRVIFIIILGLIVLMVATYVVDSLTGWFSGWFDFWPFNGADDVAVEEEARRWWQFGSDAPEDIMPAVEAEGETRWYCKWNPIC